MKRDSDGLGFEFGFHGGVGFHRDWRIENGGVGFSNENGGKGLSIERRTIERTVVWWFRV